MNIKDLQIFENVVREKSISRAAEKLNYVQSNVTSRIQKLEKELDTTLFYRHKKGMILTPAGQELIHYAREIIILADKMKMIASDEETPSGKLQIASVDTVIKLPLILSKFSEDYNQVDLTLSTGVTSQLRDKVLDFKLDGAFITKGKSTYHHELAEVDVFHEKLVLVADQSAKNLDEVIKRPILVFSEGCGYRAKLNEWLQQKNIVPAKIMELGTLETTLGSVISGLGIALVPYSTVKHYEENKLIKCFNLPDKYSNITTVFIYRQAKQLTPALEKFIETIYDSRHETIKQFNDYENKRQLNERTHF